MYIGKNDTSYGDIEETVLASLLIEPKYMEKLLVEEKHFKKFGYVFSFMKTFYGKYKNLDVSIMLSVVKNTSLVTLVDAITYLLDIFVIPTRCVDYQKRLVEMYQQNKKEEWIKKKICNKTMDLCVGNINLEKFNYEVRNIYKQADKMKWE